VTNGRERPICTPSLFKESGRTFIAQGQVYGTEHVTIWYPLHGQSAAPEKNVSGSNSRIWGRTSDLLRR